MGEGQKSPKPTAARFALAENLKLLMAAGGHKAEDVASKLRAMGYEDFSYKTIERMCNPYYPSSPNLASIEAVADFFRVELHTLLVRRKTNPGIEPMLKGSETRIREKPLQESGIQSRIKRKT